eukprot:jgi/Mesvir1/4641/Mv07804-RA.1
MTAGLGPWLWSCNCAAGASNHRFIPQPGGPDQRRTDLAPWAARGTDGSSGDCGPLETSETGSSADDSNQLGASKEFNDHNQSSSQVVAAGSKRSNYEVLADGASTKGSTGMVAATKEQSPAVKAAISMLKFYKGLRQIWCAQRDSPDGVPAVAMQPIRYANREHSYRLAIGYDL